MKLGHGVRLKLNISINASKETLFKALDDYNYFYLNLSLAYFSNFVLSSSIVF